LTGAFDSDKDLIERCPPVNLMNDLPPDEPGQHQKDKGAEDIVAYYFDTFVQRPINRHQK
jgi:hypothetical protein